MKGLATFVVSVASASLSSAGIVLPRDASPKVLAAEALAVPLYAAKRALPNAPSGNYAPETVDCPSNSPTIRSASSLSTDEVEWLEKRRNNTIDPMIEWLTRMNITGFDASGYINSVRNNASQLPNIGIGVSGGGYRALMNGAGFLAAADSRTDNSTNTGQIGGLLQATTYLAGLSGGGWLVGSIYNNNFTSVQTLRDGIPGQNVWEFENSIFDGPGSGIRATADYFTSIVDQVDAKRNAGYNASITDYWGRALSYQLIGDTDGGLAYTWSSIALSEGFINGEQPLPLLVADGRAPGETLISLNSTVYEFNPWEMGSWDPTTYGFAPLEWVGSNFSGGVINGNCVRGFDNSGYVMGTSSSLFNSFLLNINSTAIPTILRNIFTSVLTSLGDENDDIAQWQPNPFYGFNNETNPSAQSQQLTLVDGGLDLQNIPLNPLIQPGRHVDVIFAVDSSADVNNWPNGTAIIATYERSTNTTMENGTAFPAIPDTHTFRNLGLNNRPTFFGCDATNTTDGIAPLIVYLPNAPYIYPSNVSTFQPSYNTSERNLIIQNGYEGATQGNGTLDAQWPTCVACAVLSRSFFKTNTQVPADCTACFERYCWNGTTDTTTPSAEYNPEFRIEQEHASGAGSVGVVTGWVTVAALAAAFFLS